MTTKLELSLDETIEVRTLLLKEILEVKKDLETVDQIPALKNYFQERLARLLSISEKL